VFTLGPTTAATDSGKKSATEMSEEWFGGQTTSTIIAAGSARPITTAERKP